MNEENNQLNNNMDYSFDFSNQVSPNAATPRAAMPEVSSPVSEPKLVDVSVPVNEPTFENSNQTAMQQPGFNAMEKPTPSSLETPVLNPLEQPVITPDTVVSPLEESAPVTPLEQPAITPEAVGPDTINMETSLEQPAASDIESIETSSMETSEIPEIQTEQNVSVTPTNNFNEPVMDQTKNVDSDTKSTIKFVIIMGIIIVVAIIALPYVFNLIQNIF